MKPQSSKFKPRNTHLPDFHNDFQLFDDKNQTFFPHETGLSFYCSILYQICQEENIDFVLLSDDWLIKLTQNHQNRYIFGYKFGINDQTAGQIADDKYATYDALRHVNIPIIEHAVCYDKTNKKPYAKNRNTASYVAEYLHAHADHIVLKPSAGTCGQGVQQITRELEIPYALEKIFHQSFSAVMCPFYHILAEYRIVILDNLPRLIYKKTPTANQWKFNLKTGALAEDVQDEDLKQKITQIAIAAAQTLNLRFCSVDIIETTAHDFLIMEVNSGVMIRRFLKQHPEKYPLVKQIYRDAILKMFV